MKEEYKNLPLEKNEEEKRFEMHVGDLLADIVYKQEGNTMMLIHTEVEPALEGKGAATAIVEKALNYLEQHNIKLIPLCPVVVAYIKKHPEWERILDERVKK